MRIFVFASGSGGNCLLVSDKGTNILIDAGISMRRIENCLSQAGFSMDDITGVFITHEHSDHISALKTMVKKHKADIFAPHTVASRIIGMIPETEGHFTTKPVGEPFGVGELTVSMFRTNHDTDESVGYRVEGSACFAIATDTGVIDDTIRAGLYGADAVLIESNHDEQMLRDGAYPAYLKRRILSERGHLSNDACASLAKELALRGTGKIILGHLSKANNTPQKAMEAAEKALSGTGAELFCAPEFGRLEIVLGEEALCLR